MLAYYYYVNSWVHIMDRVIWARVRERESVCVCVCVCVWEREREREREREIAKDGQLGDGGWWAITRLFFGPSVQRDICRQMEKCFFSKLSLTSRPWRINYLHLGHVYFTHSTNTHKHTYILIHSNKRVYLTFSIQLNVCFREWRERERVYSFLSWKFNYRSTCSCINLSTTFFCKLAIRL